MGDWKKDFSAGLAVALVAIPLCLGIAHASGAPLISGLLGGMVGGIVVGRLSGSHLSVSGPAAGLTTIVLAAITQLQSFPAFLAATAIAGVLQILFGRLRVGALSRLFPSPVIKGMLAAIGLTLIFKQFPHLVGYDFEAFGVEEFNDTAQDLEGGYSGKSNTLTLIAQAFSHLESGALLVGMMCLAILIVWERWFQKRWPTLPGSLVAVGAALALNAATGLVKESHEVAIPSLSQGFLTFPDWGALANPNVWGLAITIALVASVESLLTVEALDRIDPRHRVSPPDQELVAQGVGNLLCGLVGGLPVTSVVVRGSVNLAAGATSRNAAIFHGVLIIIAVTALHGMLNEIPLAALAAVLVHVGAKMASPAMFRKMFHRGWSQIIPYVSTIVAILFTDLLRGIVIGTLVSAAFILRSLHHGKGFRISKRGMVTYVQFDQEVTFFHKVQLAALFDSLPDASVVELDGTLARGIDHDVLDLIESFLEQAPARQIEVILGGIALMPSFSDDQKAQMKREYDTLLENNRQWVAQRRQEDPLYFEKMVQGQKPTFLFIGCSDSRVPAETITCTEPGKLFVHRNIANVVSRHDMNFMSVLQYSVQHLCVPHIIICGHYGCGGVRAALSSESYGLIDNWVQPIKAVVEAHQSELDAIADPNQRERRVIELHVLRQVRNVLQTAVVQASIRKLGIPKVHGWVYDLETGEIKDLQADVGLEKDIHPVYHFHFSFEEPLQPAKV